MCGCGAGVLLRWSPPAACCACSAAAAGSEPQDWEHVCDHHLHGPLGSALSSEAPPRSCRRPAASAENRSPPSARPGSDRTLLQDDRLKTQQILDKILSLFIYLPEFWDRCESDKIICPTHRFPQSAASCWECPLNRHRTSPSPPPVWCPWSPHCEHFSAPETSQHTEAHSSTSPQFMQICSISQC